MCVHAGGALLDGHVAPNHASIMSAHALYGGSQCVCVVISGMCVHAGGALLDGGLPVSTGINGFQIGTRLFLQHRDSHLETPYLETKWCTGNIIYQLQPACDQRDINTTRVVLQYTVTNTVVATAFDGDKSSATRQFS